MGRKGRGLIGPPTRREKPVSRTVERLTVVEELQTELHGVNGLGNNSELYGIPWGLGGDTPPTIASSPGKLKNILQW